MLPKYKVRNERNSYKAGSHHVSKETVNKKVKCPHQYQLESCWLIKIYYDIFSENIRLQDNIEKIR